MAFRGGHHLTGLKNFATYATTSAKCGKGGESLHPWLLVLLRSLASTVIGGSSCMHSFGELTVPRS
jgi:hypothetical protein